MNSCHPSCVDPTLTIKNLSLVTASVEDWHNLGKYVGGLGVPITVRDMIKNNASYQTVEKRKEALLLYYWKTVPRASWQSVAGALHRREEVAASQAIKRFLNDTSAGRSSNSIWVSVLKK